MLTDLLTPDAASEMSVLVTQVGVTTRRRHVSEFELPRRNCQRYVFVSISEPSISVVATAP